VSLRVSRCYIDVDAFAWCWSCAVVAFVNTWEVYDRWLPAVYEQPSTCLWTDYSQQQAASSWWQASVQRTPLLFIIFISCKDVSLVGCGVNFINCSSIKRDDRSSQMYITNQVIYCHSSVSLFLFCTILHIAFYLNIG